MAAARSAPGDEGHRPSFFFYWQQQGAIRREHLACSPGGVHVRAEGEERHRSRSRSCWRWRWSCGNVARGGAVVHAVMMLAGFGLCYRGGGSCFIVSVAPRRLWFSRRVGTRSDAWPCLVPKIRARKQPFDKPKQIRGPTPTNPRGPSIVPAHTLSVKGWPIKTTFCTRAPSHSRAIVPVPHPARRPGLPPRPSECRPLSPRRPGRSGLW